MAQQLVYLVQIRKENQIMKKTITTLAILLVLIGFEAEASQLILRTNNYSSKVIISGNSYFSNNGEFWVQQMPAGRHFITITDRGNRGDNRGQGRRNGQGARTGSNVLFQGKIVMPHQSIVTARLTDRGRLIIELVEPIRRQRHTPRRSCNNPPNYRNGSGTDYGDRRGANRNTRPPIQRCVSSYNLAINQIRNASFESERKVIARQYIRTNTVSSREVLEMIQQFDFESTKLEIAKLAYGNTVDPQKYFIVNKGFGFSSSSTALDRYIRNF